MSATSWLFLGAFVGLAVCSFVLILRQRTTNQSLQRDLDYYKGTYLCKQGWTSGYGKYDLRSFDGGVSWYAVERGSKTEEVKILGPAGDIHPGLMAELEGMEKLVNYVKKYGPIGANGGLTSDDWLVLSGAGFSINQKSG
jgi:hypothetical protein